MDTAATEVEGILRKFLGGKVEGATTGIDAAKWKQQVYERHLGDNMYVKPPAGTIGIVVANSIVVAAAATIPEQTSPHPEDPHFPPTVLAPEQTICVGLAGYDINPPTT